MFQKISEIQNTGVPQKQSPWLGGSMAIEITAFLRVGNNVSSVANMMHPLSGGALIKRRDSRESKVIWARFIDKSVGLQGSAVEMDDNNRVNRNHFRPTANVTHDKRPS